MEERKKKKLVLWKIMCSAMSSRKKKHVFVQHTTGWFSDSPSDRISDLCTHFRRPADLQMASCLIVGHPIPTIGDDWGSFVYGIFDGFILSVYHPLVYYHVHLCQVMMCPFNGQVVLHRHFQTPNKTCSWWCIPLYLLSIHIESREILTGIMCSIHVILLLHVG